ncbi:uncharacterized protein [Nicotiana tomentosiformis]|uniref:uncharacterized protein n=1 Tax=Nicotiana tomentosiformis TaxID=4098 RepID=UPI00388C40D7
MCDLSFMVGEKVLLKVSPMKGIMRFERRGKLSSRFLGSFEVFERVGEGAYMLALPSSLSRVHPIFQVSMLRRYHADRSHVLDYSIVHMDESLSYDEEPIAIVDRHVLELRSKKISTVNSMEESVRYAEQISTLIQHFRYMILNPFEDEHLFKR